MYTLVYYTIPTKYYLLHYIILFHKILNYFHCHYYFSSRMKKKKTNSKKKNTWTRICDGDIGFTTSGKSETFQIKGNTTVTYGKESTLQVYNY